MKKDTMILLAIIGAGAFLLMKNSNASTNSTNSLADAYNKVTAQLTDFSNTLLPKVNAIQQGTQNQNDIVSAYENNPEWVQNAENAFGNSSGSIYNNPSNGPSSQTTVSPSNSSGGLSESDFVSQALDPNNSGSMNIDNPF